MTLKDAGAEIIKCPVCKTNQFKLREDCLRCGSTFSENVEISLPGEPLLHPEVTAPPYQTISMVLPETVKPEGKPGFIGASVYSRPTQLLEPAFQEQNIAQTSTMAGRFPLLILAGAALFVLGIGIAGIFIITGLNKAPAPLYNSQEGVVNVQKSPNASPLPEFSPPGVNLQVPTSTIQPPQATNPSTQSQATIGQTSPIPTNLASQTALSVTSLPSTPAQNLVTPNIKGTNTSGPPSKTANSDNTATTGSLVGTPGNPTEINKLLINQVPLVKPGSHSKPINSTAFNSSGTILATGGLDGHVKLWQLPDLVLLRDFQPENSYKVFSVAFSPDGRYIAAGSSDGYIREWSSESYDIRIEKFIGHLNGVYSVAFSPDGKTLASGGADNQIYLWNAQTGEKKETLSGFINHVETVVFNRQGNLLAAGSDDKSVRVWDLQKAKDKPAFTFTEHQKEVYQVAFNPFNDKILASADLNGQIKVWDLNKLDLKSVKTLTTKGQNIKIFSIAFSPNGQKIVSGQSDDKIGIWDTNSGQLENTLDNFNDFVKSVSFSPNNSSVVPNGEEEKVVAGDNTGAITIYTVTSSTQN